jgi:hypothetical protein
MSHRFTAIIAGLALASPGLHVQAQAGPTAAPRYLVFGIEEVKVGKAAAHQALEHSWANAFAKAKTVDYSVALTPIAAPNQAMWMSAWNSMKEMQDADQARAKNKALTAEIAEYAARDAEYVSAGRTEIWGLRPDLSYRDTIDWPKMHTYELISVRVRPGHESDLRDFVKRLREAHQKGGTGARWAMYEAQFGAPGGAFLVVIPMTSIADIDKGVADDAKFAAALGEAGGKELDKYASDGNLTSTSNLYGVDPKMSYVPDTWMASDMDFWRSSGVMQAGAPADKKPKKP